jgi:predicted Fe-Mo cluster-binding NifX family protein
MTERIRIVVPTEGAGGIDSPRSAHFGRAGSFTLVDVVDGEISSAGAVMNPSRDQGGCAATVATLAEIGAAGSVSSSMGARRPHGRPWARTLPAP